LHRLTYHARVVPFEELRERAEALGLAVRGAFHPRTDEFAAASLGEDVSPGFRPASTVVLLGFTGGMQWPVFRDSAEARDGAAHPLDRWSRRVIGSLARTLGAHDFYPSGSPRAPVPFQRLAARCEPVYPSPIGLLIHSTWGLWHAYRGGLAFAERLELPPIAQSSRPCDGCRAQPCLSGCPVGAFQSGSFDLEACVTHVSSAAGTECRERGCRARRACPVGAEYAYAPDQSRFHMRAFLDSVRR
jgi:hypothetical protein